MRRILITNDDGIRAAGIIRLALAAQAFGEITVIAPETQCSALSHSITINRPVDFVPYAFPVPGVTAWTCSGTPSDCVRAALAYLLPEIPDLVLSGINNGCNSASDIQYSATVGAALEAAHEGIPAIAVSEPYGADPSVADSRLPGVLSALVDRSPGKDAIFNVNFPLGTCRGILTDRFVSAGSLYKSRYRLTEGQPANGLRLITDDVPGDICEEGSDLKAILDGFISVGVVRNIG